jgi:decaprenyl-phosphate phosphoribosyltransferase
LTRPLGHQPSTQTPAPQQSYARALLKEARPRQWTKNVLVGAAPAAAGVLFVPATLGRVGVAFVAFCLASSGTYYLNDAMDAEADRLHPIKRHRPIAAGLISVRAGFGMAAALMLAALLVSLVLGSAEFTGAVALYLALTVSYSLWLKHLPVVDIVVVAAGFIIRAVAGGLAAGVPLSRWFLIVASFGALFIVTGKRHSEVATLGEGSRSHRAVLEAYTTAYTQHLLTIASGITIVAYCLWAFETQDLLPGGGWLTLSILPFVMVMLRYGMLVLAGRGGEPEEIVLKDREIQALGAAWAVLVLLGIYVG